MSYCIEEIQNICEESPKIGGSECRFVKINDKVGLKLYFYEYERDECYARQSELFKRDLAPEVYDTINLEKGIPYFSDDDYEDDYENEEPDIYRFGYFTEIVSTLGDKNFQDLQKDYAKYEILFDELRHCLKNLKCGQVTDLRDENIGLKNGRLVVIDCGECTFSQWDGDPLPLKELV